MTPHAEAKQKMMQGLAPTVEDDIITGGEGQTFSDQQNIKCSIEIKNGIP